MLNDRTQKFEVKKLEYIKGADNYKEINDEENENKIQDEPKEQPQEEQNQQAAE